MHNEIVALHAYLTRLRQNPLFSACEFVFIVEANASWVRAKEICLYVNDRFPPCTLVTENKPGNKFRPGVWVGPEDKDRFVALANDFLRNGRVKLWQGFVSDKADPKHCQNIVRMLKDQMLKYRRNEKPVTDHSTVTKRAGVWSGKDTSGFMKDDLCMSWIQGLYHAACFMADPIMTAPFAPQIISAVNKAGFYRRTYMRASVDDVVEFDPRAIAEITVDQPVRA